MISLVIDLQEGFDGILVAVMLDGREVFRKDDVRTRYQVGLADHIELDVAPGDHSVRVTLPDKDIEAEMSFDATDTPYLGVSVEQMAISIKPVAEPYRYL